MFSRAFKNTIYRTALASHDVFRRFKEQPTYQGHAIYSGLRMDSGAEVTMQCGVVLRVTEDELRHTKPNGPLTCIRCRSIAAGLLG